MPEYLMTVTLPRPNQMIRFALVFFEFMHNALLFFSARERDLACICIHLQSRAEDVFSELRLLSWIFVCVRENKNEKKIPVPTCAVYF